MSLVEPDGSQHHIALRPGDVGRYVLLPGDPGRVERIARRFDEPRFVAEKREYVTWTGRLDGVPVSCTSTGIGCPSTAIAVEELAAIGVDTFIRVGTAGALQRGIRTGDVAVVTGGIRDEGTSRHYLPIEFPAVADLDVTLALREGARSTGYGVHVGVAQSKDSFYGQHEPERMPVADALAERWKAWMAGGAVASEMEASALFIVASTLRVRAGGVMLLFQNLDHLPPTPEEQALGDVERVIDAAIAGLRVLIRNDRASGRLGS